MACLLSAANAQAEPIEDRVRLTLDTTPFAIINSTVRGSIDLDLDGYADEEQYDSDQVTIGIAPSFGASIGFGVGPQFLVGLRLSLTSTTTEQKELNTSTAATTILALPYVTFVGGDDTSTTRFTASIMAGLGTTRVRAGGQAARNASGGALGASIGFLGFAAPQFSLDPSVFVLYEVGSGTIGDSSSTSADFDYSGTTIGVMISFSGWLGEDRSGAREVVPLHPRPRPRTWTGATPAPREDPVTAEVAAPASRPAVLSTRTTLDSAIFMLLGAPESRGPEVALRLQRYAPAGEAACGVLEVELDGVVTKTIPLKQTVRDDNSVQEVTVQGSIDVDVADQMVKARTTKLRWCGNERTLSLAARDGISRFIAEMRARLASLPPLEAPAAPAEESSAPAPAPTTDAAATPAPAPVPAAPPAATP